jgi:large subunit ribosomal protein L4
MKVSLLDNSKESVEFADALFGAKFNEPLVHQVVTAYLAGQRAGTKAQKNRSDVRGGGAKPWRQKGTGRARAGTSRSPLWIGGGRTFAARPRDHAQKVNRKMYRAALRSMFSELLRQGRLLVAQDLSVTAPKTKELKAKLDALGVERALLVVEAFDQNLWLAARNLPHVLVDDIASVNPASLASAQTVVLTVAAAKILEERLA